MKLTPTQLEVVVRTFQHDGGRVGRYIARPSTRDALIRAGLVEPGPYIKDPRHRASFSKKREQAIRLAEGCLTRGDWKHARQHLNQAARFDDDLNLESWWLTKAGIELACETSYRKVK